MKKWNVLYALTFLLVCALFMNGCKKESYNGKRSTSLDTANATVSTVIYGYYDYIAADLSGNIYALRYNADSIYKIDASGNKTLFYTPPTEMQNDTVVNQSFICLATDSAGNVYSLNYHNSITPSLVKITPAASASVVFDSSIIDDGYPTEKIAVSQGNYYFSDSKGIHKVTSAGVASIIADPKSPVFTVNRNGVVYYADYFGSNDYLNVNRINADGTTTIIAGAGKPGSGAAGDNLFSDIVDLTTDKTGNIFVSESNDINAILHIINPAGTVTQLITTPFGHADGPIAKAKIGVAFSLTTDGSDDLYFSELTLNPNDIRKIAFN